MTAEQSFLMHLYFSAPWNKGFAAESSPFTIYVTTFPSAATGSYYGLLDLISTCYFEIQPLTAFDSATVWKVIMWLRWHKLKVDSKLNLKWHWNALIKSTKIFQIPLLRHSVFDPSQVFNNPAQTMGNKDMYRKEGGALLFHLFALNWCKTGYHTEISIFTSRDEIYIFPWLVFSY